MVEMSVWQMVLDEKTRFPIVILQEKDGPGKLPIWIGPAEAQAIALEMQGKKFQRPLTHDLLVTMVRALKAEVRKIEISALKENTFYARIILQRDNELISVDARPSDSIAIALRMKAAIFAARELLTGELDGSFATGDPEESPEPEREPSPDEKADRLRRFIEGIDPEDFGRYSI